MEKMSITKALDERDFLKKKIKDSIPHITFSYVKRKKDVKLSNGDSVEEFKNKVKANYQSCRDMIDRYNRINAAITLSNAKTNIEIAGTTMTVAAAISFKKAMSYNETSFEKDLINVMLANINNSTTTFNKLNNLADNQLEQYKIGLIGRDSSKKLSEEEVAMTEKMVEGLYAEIIDPINVQEEYTKLSDHYNSIVSEINTAIKISNAITEIEF